MSEGFPGGNGSPEWEGGLDRGDEVIDNAAETLRNRRLGGEALNTFSLSELDELNADYDKEIEELEKRIEKIKTESARLKNDIATAKAVEYAEAAKDRVNRDKAKENRGLKGFLSKKATRVAAAVMAILIVAGIGVHHVSKFGIGNNEQNKMTGNEELYKYNNRQALEAPEPDAPIIFEDTGEEKESISDISTYKGQFASEDGTTYNSDKNAKYNFGKPWATGISESEEKEQFKDGMSQPGQLATTYVYMQQKTTDPNFGIDGVKFDDPNALIKAMNEDGELHQKIYDYITELADKNKMSEDTVNGLFHNYFLDSKFETGDVDTSNVEVVSGDTIEHDTKVSILEYRWIDENGNEHTDTFMFKKPCHGQPLDQKTDFTTKVRKIYDPETPPPGGGGSSTTHEHLESKNASQQIANAGSIAEYQTSTEASATSHTENIYQGETNRQSAETQKEKDGSAEEEAAKEAERQARSEAEAAKAEKKTQEADEEAKATQEANDAKVKEEAKAREEAEKRDREAYEAAEAAKKAAEEEEERISAEREADAETQELASQAAEAEADELADLFNQLFGEGSENNNP